jgi:type IV secretory pathway TraG/TraD family ATPase VirD4
MDGITYIGILNYRNKRTRFGIKNKDRSGHIYCIGKTGVGKSTLVLHMAISDIVQGNGIGIIDPHGDLSETILDYIPKHRIDDVIYFNATDRECPIAFNPLFNVDPQHHYLVASALVSSLKKAWSDSWGPRLEHILRNTILTLLHYPGATLLHIQPLLTDVNFRNEVLVHITDTILLRFWYNEFGAMSPTLKAEAISPIVNKIGLFQTHPLIRAIIGQEKSSFSIADVMNEKKIFIANLSKGSLGEDGTQLLGSLLVTQFQTATLERAHQHIDTRIPFYLYIDEMHSFVTLSFADMLAESRKYGLCLFLTHQSVKFFRIKMFI